MDSSRAASVRADGAVVAASQGVLIAVSFYKNEQLVQPLLESLIASAADIAAIGGEVLLYVDSPDYAPLVATLDAALPAAQAAFPCRLMVNQVNLGFVRTMNLAVAEAVETRRDLLLLNSDTQVEPGALAEMVRVMRLDHMTGFVNPRSDNATIATLPLRYVPADRADGRAAFRAMAAMLPETSYVSTCVGFCMLIPWRVLAEFGGLDEVYGKGYNEENDLVMRAGRCGFRAVLANHAFVWHEGERSFASSAVDRSVWERVNRAILDERYPEYGPHTAAYYQSPEYIGERLLSMLFADSAGKFELAFDFSSFRAAHNGTFQAGRQLLQVAQAVWGDRFRIHVLCSEEVYAFHDYTALGIPRADPHDGQLFTAIFRVGQPYDWNVLQRLSVTGAVIGVYMLDTISVDCPPLASNLLHAMWQFTLDHVDLVATQSRQTQQAFARRFRMPPAEAQLVSLHSVDLDDYRLPGTDGVAAPEDGAPRVLVLGNHFHHKYLAPTANALAAAFPERHIVALGAPTAEERERSEFPPIPELMEAANLEGVAVGKLTDAEIGAYYAACEAVVFPSHAEGFGFPALNALAAKRPLFVRRLPVFEEIWQHLSRTPNMYFYDTTPELIELMRQRPRWIETPDAITADNGATRSAKEIRGALDQAILRASYSRIVERVRAVQLASAFLHETRPVSMDTDAAKAARFLANGVERAARRLLGMRIVYQATRIAFRASRATARLLRR